MTNEKINESNVIKQSEIDDFVLKKIKRNDQDEAITTKVASQNFESKAKQHKTIRERVLSIDRFRGLCVFFFAMSILMGIFGQNIFVGDFGTFLGSLFEHADRKEVNDAFMILPPILGEEGKPSSFGVSLADLFAPMFIFAIGLSLIPSFRSREKKYGTFRAYVQLVTRFLALIGLGSVLNGLENGWGDIWFQETPENPDDLVTFDKLDTILKIFAAGFFIFLILLIPNLGSMFIKTDKYKIKTICSSCNKWFLAIIGLIALYFIAVYQGESIAQSSTHIYGGYEWDTLQNIGFAGLVALPFITINKWGKLLFLVIIIALMAVIYQNGLFQISTSIVEGGLIGGIMWATILLFGVFYYEIRDEKSYWIMPTILLIISVALVVGLKLYAFKRGCTPMYALFTSSIGGIIFGIFHLFNNFKPKYDFLADWGTNPIFIYLVFWMLNVILVGTLAKDLEKLAWWAELLCVLFIVASFSVFNWLLRWKKINIKL